MYLPSFHQKRHFLSCDLYGLVEMSLQHIKKNSPGLLHTPAKFEKNQPNGHRVIRKTKHRAGRPGRTGFPPIYKQASLVGRLIITFVWHQVLCLKVIAAVCKYLDQTSIFPYSVL